MKSSVTPVFVLSVCYKSAGLSRRSSADEQRTGGLHLPGPHPRTPGWPLTVKPIKWKKSEKCKTCDGYGAAIYTKSTFVKCKACAATGNMMQIPGKSGAMYPKCEICDGSGFLDMFCKTCKGTGFSEMVIEEMMVQIPAGTPSGFQLIMRGRGELAKGGIAGNLHVVVIEQARS
jgi:DnaJ-class molecular chaperone